MLGNLSKGTGNGLYANLFFGYLREVIAEMFGDLKIVLDPHAKFYETLSLIASFMEIDLGFRHVKNFAAMNDAIAC